MNELDDEAMSYCELAVLLAPYPGAIAIAATTSD